MAVRIMSPGVNPVPSSFTTFTDQTRAAATNNTSAMDKINPFKNPSIASILSPLEMVAPSPVVSEVGTEFSDTDESFDESPKTQPDLPKFQPANKVASPRGPSLKLDTKAQKWGSSARMDIEEPLSVIHAPQGFKEFHQRQPMATISSAVLPQEQKLTSDNIQNKEPSPLQDDQTTEIEELPQSPLSDASAMMTAIERSTPEPLLPSRPDAEHMRTMSKGSIKSDATVTETTKRDDTAQSKARAALSFSSSHPPVPSALKTSLPLTHDLSTTPRAQTKQEFGAMDRHASNLASILEHDDTDYTDETGDESDPGRRAAGFLRGAEAEMNALKSALSECWSLCNSLASLSYVHRERIFNFSGRRDAQQQAWKSCWKLCQNLYDTREDSTFGNPHSRATLDLCRDFCQALFEVRARDNETADSVLRVSFELNNHLFNIHHPSLPEPFRERTLDFYITLCHRLMKQKAKMAEESDSLLRSCWSLAEMLFSMRQNHRDGRKPDEELLGSAIQSCWELCDLFREGWTQIRPDRGTPRPSTTTFTQAFMQAKKSGFEPIEEAQTPRTLPETPTTIFEDTVNIISPDDDSRPNILVLDSQPTSSRPMNTTPAPGSVVSMGRSRAGSGVPWSSASSTVSLSAQSDILTTTSIMTASTIRTPGEDPRLTLLKTLFVRAAVHANKGYSRTSSDPNMNNLVNFVKVVPDNSFGTQAWQVSLLDNYRKAVTNDPGFRNLGAAATIGERGRLSSVEAAQAVKGMISCVHGFGWLRDLYRYVFGFYLEEALRGGDGKSSGNTSTTQNKTSDNPSGDANRRQSKS